MSSNEVEQKKQPYDPVGRKSSTTGITGAIEKFLSELPDGTVALNVGCGQTRMDRFVNVDFMPDDAVDVTCNLFEPNWPIADQSVGFVYMSNFLEHVPGTAWATFWNEIWRVCADGARLMIISPHARSDRYLQDPTHCQPIIDRKFMYLSKSWREGNRLNHGYYCKPDVNILMDIRPWKLWHNDVAMREDSAKLWAELHDTNAIEDQVWYLKAFRSEASLEAYKRVIEAQMNGQEVQGKTIEV